MVYEYISGCFIAKDPSSRFLELFQVVVVVVHGDIFRAMALMLGASKLLAVAKDIGGLHPIIVSKVSLRLISHSIVLQLQGPFISIYPPTNWEFQPLEAMNPSFLASKPL